MEDSAPRHVGGAVWWPRVRNFLAGYNSGIFLVLAGHPFDTIKVRLQAEGKLDHPDSVRCRSFLIVGCSIHYTHAAT